MTVLLFHPSVNCFGFFVNEFRFNYNIFRFLWIQVTALKRELDAYKVECMRLEAQCMVYRKTIMKIEGGLTMFIETKAECAPDPLCTHCEVENLMKELHELKSKQNK